MARVAINAKSMKIIALPLSKVSKGRNMFIAERFLSSINSDYGKHLVSTDGGGTCYPMTCQFLKLKHYIYSSFAKMRKVLLKGQCST